MYERDLDETVLKSHHGIYSFNRVFSGIIISPDLFRRSMDMIHAALKWQLAFVYFNDIVIYFKTPEEHVAYVRRVLTM